MDRTYFGPVAISLVLHILLVVVAAVGVSMEIKHDPIKAPRYIEAVVVDEGVLKALEDKKLAERKKKEDAKLAERKKRDQEKARKEKQKKAEEERKRAKAKERKKREEAKKAAEKKRAEQAKALALKKKKEKEKKEREKKKKEEARKKKELERKRIAEEKKEKERKAALKKKQEEIKRREEKRKRREALEKKLLEESKKAEELKAQRELEAKRKAEEDRLRQEALAAQKIADANETDRYRSLIQRRIIDRWKKPLSARLGMKAVLRISLLPSGELLKAELIRSSGNSAFDNSALSAAQSVARYPVPSDPRLFESSFRHFTLVFNPKD